MTVMGKMRMADVADNVFKKTRSYKNKNTNYSKNKSNDKASSLKEFIMFINDIYSGYILANVI